MSAAKKNILIVELDAETYESAAPPLLRTLFEVDRIPSAKGGLELVSMVPFAAIVLSYPLEGMALDDFLAAVRQPGSASRSSEFVLLTRSKNDESAERYLNKGVKLIISLEDPMKQREEKLCTLLGISPRQDTRVLVKLHVALQDAKHDRFIAQTKDISVSGMFVITRKRHPIGSPASFEFTVASDPSPITGVAEVMRHSDETARVSGMGFKFISFKGDSMQRLTALVEAKEL